MSRSVFSLLLFVLLLTGLSSAGMRADTLLQINCGGGAVSTFSADKYYTYTGVNSAPSTPNPIYQRYHLAPMQIYQTCNASTGTLTYTLPGFKTNRKYWVSLYFAELQYNTAGARLMNIAINGQAIRTNYDIYVNAGSRQYTEIALPNLSVVPNTNGSIQVTLTAVVSSCCISGIQVASQPVFPRDNALPIWGENALPSDGAGVTGAGPSSADMVNLASGVYENRPDADIGARNPLGPSPLFARTYRTQHAATGYSSPGLPPGWTHNYDLRINTYSAGTNSINLTITYPNGGTNTWGANTGASGVPISTQPGTPYLVTGAVDTSPLPAAYWQALTVTFKDRSRWIFTPVPGQSSNYRLTSMVNALGYTLYLQFDSAGRLQAAANRPFTTNPTPQTGLLMTCAYDGSGYIQSIVEYTDPAHPRNVLYTCGNGVPRGDLPGDAVAGDICLLTVSQIGAVLAQRGDLWRYAYQDAGYGPFLVSVSAPPPSGAGNYATHQIAYTIGSNSGGYVSSLTDADLNTRAYTYHDASSADVQVQGAGGQAGETWTQITTGLDNGSKDALNKQDTISYNDGNNPYSPTQVINKNNQSAQMTYDAMGNVTSTTVPVNGNLLTTGYGYDYTHLALGQLTSIQVGTKTPTTIAYDPNTGLINQVGTPTPGTSGTGDHVYTTYAYTALGNVATVTMPAPNNSGQPVQIAYNYASDISIATFDQPGGVSQNEALGRPLTVTDPMGHVTHYRYDARGNVIAVITTVNGVPRETDIAYNVADQPVQVMYPATALGRKSTTTTYSYPGGPATATTLYDEPGNQARQTTATLGGEGQAKAQTGSVEHSSAVLDGLSRLSQLKDGNGNAFQHVYDSVGNLKQLKYPGGGSNTATYDADGNPTSATDALNRTATYTLAPDDSRLQQVNYSDNTPVATYDYDAYGRVKSITDSTVTLTYAYDDLDNVIGATTYYADYAPTHIDPFSLTYAYFPDGHRSSLSSPQAGVYNYTYDLDGKLTGVSFPWRTTCTYTYDDGERLTRKSASLSVTTYTYNALDQVTQQSNYTPSGTPQTAYTSLTYDTVGNLLGYNDQYSLVANLAGGRTFTYDGEDRLTGESSSRRGVNGSDPRNGLGHVNYTYAHAYDEADNFTTLRGQAVTSNTPASQLLQDGRGFTYGYDAEGNTHQINTPAQPTATIAAYDALNHLTVTYNSGPPMPPPATWIYRPDGLLGSTPVGTDPYHPGRVYRVYDGTQLLFEHYCFPQGVNSDSNLPSADMHTEYGWGVDGIAETYVTADYEYGYDYVYALYALDEVVGYICDPMGNIASHVYYGDATDLDYAFYDAWGLLTGYIGPYYVVPSSLWYKGQSGAETPPNGFGGFNDPSYSDPFNPANAYPGQILMGYRWYNPALGRFWTRDPQGYAGGINLYAFVRNNPVMRADPMGLDGLDDAANFFAGWGDALTFNATALVRQGLGVNQVVNTQSSTYKWGTGVGTVHSLALAAPAVLKVAQSAKSGYTACKLLWTIRNVNTVKGVAGAGYTGMNCTSAAIATDLTLAGRSASALNITKQGAQAVVDVLGGSFGNPTSIGNIMFDMTCAGDGARGIVAADRSANQIGHMFNVINKGGRIYFIDGQSGRMANIADKSFTTFKFLRTK